MNLDNYLPLVSDLGVSRIESVDVLQTLWGGYGQLVRLHVDTGSIIVKHISLPKPEHHPKGWNTEISHQRKLRSYRVELNWYKNSALTCHSKVPEPLKVVRLDDELLLVMEDLKQAGYPLVVKQATRSQISACLNWLADFHAQHIGHSGEGLWEVGTYWHLDTRPDELEALVDLELKQQAHCIDQVLRAAPFQTLVHGDAKLANFCFTPDGQQAAAVDFQYVGRGCGMKDVALFISSAVQPQQCEQLQDELLDEYFGYLNAALNIHQPSLSINQVEEAWRPLFVIAWADFQRFVKGWSPTHWKINPYTEGLKNQALGMLKAYSVR